MTKISTKKSRWQEHEMTDQSLRTRTFEATRWIVQGLIPEGLTLIAGKPKIGKSWLALDIARTVGSRAALCLSRETIHGAVAYLALEDNAKRLHNRIITINTPDHDAELTSYFNQWRPLRHGGLDDLEDWRQVTPEPTLAIIDTLAAMRVNASPQEQSYLGDYKALQGLQRWSVSNNIPVLLLHHTRKAEAEDPFDEISGTLAIGGCVDTAIVIRRSSEGTILHVRGRDVEEAAHAITLDPQKCRWQLLGEAADIHRSETRKTILKTLDQAGEPLSPAEIALRSRVNLKSVEQQLYRMIKNGDLIKTSRGKYAPPVGSIGNVGTETSKPTEPTEPMGG